MERLYAPWRMAYINKPGQKAPPGACIFCDKPAMGPDHDAANFILLRGNTCYVILNAFPYNNGHVMILPFRHIARPADQSPEEGAEMMALCALMTRILDEAFHPDGYNIGINVGSAAGAGIAAHLHLHIVPRWSGDTNFMPVIGDVKVLPETLNQVYSKLTIILERAIQEDAGTLVG